MDFLYKNIINAVTKGEKLLAVLVDPDKFLLENTVTFVEKINKSIATHIFVGGSTVDAHATKSLVIEIKKQTKLPVILFPGDITQITDAADGILFLTLLSGRNPEYLIGKHVEAVSKLRNTSLEVISTGYILIESGKVTAVENVTATKPIPRNKLAQIIDTAKAGELLGTKLIYLEAGSGARNALTEEIISSVKNEINIPLIVGGGIRSLLELQKAYQAGADLVVIGTAFEEDELFFEVLQK
jgi:putative glycerol-1-phosphate prenyltransferase